MIKILFFIETIDGGGAEKVLRNLVNNMDRTKFDITVQTLWPCDPKAYLAPGIRYRSVYPVRDRMHMLRYRLEAAAGLTYRMHIRDDYDIECACLECGATKIMAASTNKKAVKLAWIHCDLKKAMADTDAFVRETARYYKKFDRVVCVSQQGRRSFVELHGMEEKAVIVYNTIDCEEVRSKAEEPLPEGETYGYPLVVSLGRLAEPKHYIRLLRSHKRLLEEGIHHELLIVGEGPDRPMLEDYIRENDLQETASLIGFRGNPYPYLKRADLLACSSIYECYSTFIAEGLILGKPIVTTDVSGMRELLGDSEYGLITAVDDEAFYEGMKKMLLDGAVRAEYARKAAVRGEQFSTSKMVKDTEDFFVDCLRGRGE